MVVSGPSPDSEPPGAPDDGRREPTMTLTGWRRFVDAPPASFDLLPEKQWAALSAAGRQAYDEARLSYHSEMIIVATTAVREVARQGRLLTLLNRREISARRGLIVSGQQTTGKTTALKQLGRTHELMVRERYPARGGDRIPVVYVTTPPKGSPRKLAMEFARFLGLPPVRRGYNTTDIADAVCQVMLAAQVDLVLVDELHNLNLATAAGEDMSDHLKYFTEHYLQLNQTRPARVSGETEIPEIASWMGLPSAVQHGAGGRDAGAAGADAGHGFRVVDGAGRGSPCRSSRSSGSCRIWRRSRSRRTQSRRMPTT